MQFFGAIHCISGISLNQTSARLFQLNRLNGSSIRSDLYETSLPLKEKSFEMLLQKLRCPLVQGAYFIVWVIARDNIKKNVIAFFKKRELLSISS